MQTTPSQAQMRRAAAVGLHIGMRVFHRDGAKGPTAKIYGTVIALSDGHDIAILTDRGTTHHAAEWIRGRLEGMGWRPASPQALTADEYYQALEATHHGDAP